MRPLGVVVDAPTFDDCLGLLQAVKDIAILSSPLGLYQ